MIKTKQDHEKALSRIEEIFDSKPGTPEFEELDRLVLEVEAYEDEHYPIEKIFAKTLSENIKDLEPEFSKMVDENFFDLI